MKDYWESQCYAVSPSPISSAEVFLFSDYFTIGGTIMMNTTSWAKAHSPRFLCKLSDLSRRGISEHYITFHSILRHLLPVLMGLECTGRDIKWQYLVLFFFIEAVSWILGNPNSHWHGVLPQLQHFCSLFHFMCCVSLSIYVC